MERQPSPTQRLLGPADVARLVSASFGGDRRTIDCGPMSGGGFAAVWWVTLDDARTVVLKVSPEPSVPLLRYERDLLAAEARYFRLVGRLAPAVPVPCVLDHCHDGGVLDGDWLFTSLLPGQPLPELSGPERDVHVAPVRKDFGAAIARVHAITGPRYGYGGTRVTAPTWPEAFSAMVRNLLADAADWGVRLPVTREWIEHLLARHLDVLAEVSRPVLLHFDGWDGNVLAAPDETGTLRMTGLVDGERHLYGDPLMDLVSPVLYGRIEDDPTHPFLAGYAAVTGAPIVFDARARRRLTLYRLHHYLLMTVEMPSRAITRQAHPDRYDVLAALLDDQLTELGRRAPSVA